MSIAPGVTVHPSAIVDDGATVRRGPFGTVVAAGDGGFCGLHSYLSMRAGSLDWKARRP